VQVDEEGGPGNNFPDWKKFIEKIVTILILLGKSKRQFSWYLLKLS
jgi:hypothetical protein